MSQRRTLATGIARSLALCFALSVFGTSCATMRQTITMNEVGTSREWGTATLKDLGNGSTLVTFSTAGGFDAGSQSAHIHTGTCGSDGPIFAALGYVQGGTSTMTVPFTLATLSGGTHYINIHSAANPTMIQACGQIK